MSVDPCSIWGSADDNEASCLEPEEVRAVFWQVYTGCLDLRMSVHRFRAAGEGVLPHSILGLWKEWMPWPWPGKLGVQESLLNLEKFRQRQPRRSGIARNPSYPKAGSCIFRLMYMFIHPSIPLPPLPSTLTSIHHSSSSIHPSSIHHPCTHHPSTHPLTHPSSKCSLRNCYTPACFFF